MYIHRTAEKIIEGLLKGKKVIMLLGPRQVGKTTLIEHLIKRRGGYLLNLDIEVDVARFLAASSLDPDQAMQSFGNPPLLVIDEAQRLPAVGSIVKGWYDAHVANKIILLGSSSLNLLDAAAESLTGRNEKVYLMPLQFGEILKNQPWYSASFNPGILQAKFGSQIKVLLLQQMVYGGYPETITTDDKERYLLGLTSDYLLKDILQSGLVKSPDPIKKLLILLAYQVGSEVSVNELANNLDLSRQTIERYLELLERSFVIFRLHAFSTNQRKEIAKNTKIFFWDTGVRNALLKEFSFSSYRSDIGPLFENFCVAEVAKQNFQTGDKYNIYFWRSREGSEVDLVIKGTDKFMAFEFKWAKSNISGKRSFTRRYGIPVGVISQDTIINLVS